MRLSLHDIIRVPLLVVMLAALTACAAAEVGATEVEGPVKEYVERLRVHHDHGARLGVASHPAVSGRSVSSIRIHAVGRLVLSHIHLHRLCNPLNGLGAPLLS